MAAVLERDVAWDKADVRVRRTAVDHQFAAGLRLRIYHHPRRTGRRERGRRNPDLERGLRALRGRVCRRHGARPELRERPDRAYLRLLAQKGVGGLSIFSGGRQRREPSKIPYYVILVLLALFALGPLVIMVFNSLKSSAEIGRNPLGLPLSPVFENFPAAWTQGNFSTTMVNSTILTVGTIVGVCIIAGTSAYAMARLDLPGTDAVLLYLFLPVQSRSSSSWSRCSSCGVRLT